MQGRRSKPHDAEGATGHALDSAPNRDGDSHPHPHTDPDPDPNADADADSHANSDADSNPDPYTGSDPNSDASEAFTDAQATSDTTTSPIVRTLFGLKAGTRRGNSRVSH